MSSPPQPPPSNPLQSRWTAFLDIWSKATFVSWLLTFIALGLQGGIMAWVMDKLTPAITIWNVFATTAPLTVSVAILGRGLLRGSFKNPVHFLAAAVVVLGLSAYIAGSCGIPTGSAQAWMGIMRVNTGQHSANLISFLLTAFSGALQIYWNLYGAQMFCSSLLVGAFLTWLWGKGDATGTA